MCDCGDSGCGGCGSWTLPQGLTGPQGATGATGAAGANGTNGINGTNGTTIVYNDPTDSGTTNGVSTEDLKTYSLPLNTLAVNNNMIEVEAFLEETAAVGVAFPPYYEAQLLLGAQVIGYAQWGVGLSTKQITFRAQINRLTSATQKVQWENFIGGYMAAPNSAPGAVDEHTKGKTPTTADLTVANNIIVRVSKTSGTFTANEVVCTQLIVKHYKQ